MHTSELPNKKPLIDPDQVPEQVNTIRLNRIQKEKFAQGEMVMLENMQLPDGRIVDGKVKLVKDEKGELQVQLFEKKQVLEIPDQILSHKLTDKDKEDLLAEKTVAVKMVNGQSLFLQVDKDLNRVMIHTERDLSIISELGNYKLTERDKAAWANGDKLPTRIFYDETTGSHFAASIRKTEDGKGIEYHNYKSLKELDKDQLKDMIKKYNEGPDIMTATASVTNSIKTEEAVKSTPETSISKTEKTIEVNTTHDNERRFVEYTNNKDYEGLKRLAEEGFKPEKDLIDRTAKQLNLSNDEKKAVMTAIGNESQKNVPSIKEKDPVMLTLNNKPYRVVELSEDGKKALLVDSQNKKIGVSIEHVRHMSKQEKGLYVGSSQKIKQQKDQSLQI